ncbi:hypothetical protein Cgig2_012236 [Carnegiea gigantea]|uniref:SWIM-type domain-containing protein n=1 Tax=Carnegiea gigantea TaxID=171969 RepID=A0A9Q1GWJ7_9CARY|nr:hypothetical protein Cgig2_012236 [Carnegiea gigantea]
MLEQSGDGKVTCEGGFRTCMVAKEGMEVEEVIRMVKEITRSNLPEQKIWYSLKFDRQMLMALEGNMDISMILKGNDEHGYLYVDENEDEHRGGLAYAKDELTLLVMRWYAEQVGEMAMMTCNWVGKEMENKSFDGEGGECGVRRTEQRKAVMKGVHDKGVPKGMKAMRMCGHIQGCKPDVTIASQKFADAYKKMGCIPAVKCYSLILGEYNVELTNTCELVVKLRQQTCTYRQWQMCGLPCWHALAVIANANLWVYDSVYPIYKSATQ